MPLKTDKNLKRYYSIREVSELLNIPESTLRYWEKEFKEISPKKTATGIRQYSEADINQIKFVSFLVHDNHLTIKGAHQRMRENPKQAADTHDIVTRLENVRKELLAVLVELDTTPPCGQPL
ncbi:MAG: MerR family transcriptional regulator [Bacteroidaceae bacterium]|nr:MerR family transcriptional regulator [Bacteroidaceae bacterium]